jgi:hypothetical protein
VPDREGEIGPDQRMAAHGLEAMRELGRLGLQELAPRRRVEEELAHFDRRADAARAAASSPLRVSRRVACEAPSLRLVIATSATEAIAASASPRKPIVATPSRIGERGDLAGRVAAQRGRQLVGRDAVTVVLDGDGADAASAQANGDARRAGVDRVVEQLANDRRRPLDDLAGGDLADQLARQLADRPAHARLEHGVHRRIVEGATRQPGRPRDVPVRRERDPVPAS